ncbi:DNA repair protein RecO [Thermodesulfovibrio sp. 3907-1M]|uniref:DNA repair protein RecO n=1 Tax=Thermodesulfovibrio autotrophicus TaxID=3118333 RepID=A0AAU8GVC7_9BACT
MIYSTEGIVLKNTDYAEADLIVTYLSKDFGLINLFAKSPRKIKSRWGSSFEPLTYARISFIGKEDKLQKIIQSDIIKPFQTIRENYRLFLKLSEVLSLFLDILPKREPNHEIFSLFLETLFFMENTQRAENYIVFLKLKTLKILGYLPDFSHCGVCRGSLNGESFYSDGFVICKKCASNRESHMLSQGVLKLLNTISQWRLSYLERVKIAEKLMNEMEKFLKNHISNTVKV